MFEIQLSKTEKGNLKNKSNLSKWYQKFESQIKVTRKEVFLFSNHFLKLLAVFL